MAALLATGMGKNRRACRGKTTSDNLALSLVLHSKAKMAIFVEQKPANVLLHGLRSTTEDMAFSRRWRRNEVEY
jgi:hypothetical protein